MKGRWSLVLCCNFVQSNFTAPARVNETHRPAGFEPPNIEKVAQNCKKIASINIRKILVAKTSRTNAITFYFHLLSVQQEKITFRGKKMCGEGPKYA